jgi:serine protease
MKQLYILFILASFSFTSFSQSESPFVPGELLVQLVENQQIDELINDLQFLNNEATALQAKKQLSAHMHIWQLSFDDATISNSEMKRAVSNHPATTLVQFNHLVTKRETVPNDPLLSSQWHHIESGDHDIDSDLAWDITTGGTTATGDEIVVCVIEGGDLMHEDLQENRWVNTQEIPDNGIDDDNNGFVDDYDGWNVQSEDDAGVFNGSHGTSVMGMIGARGDNDMGVVGANWDVKIMSVAGESVGNEASVVSAYNYPLVMRKLYNETGGSQGAFVVSTNASWGIDNGDPDDVPLWNAVYDSLGVYGVLNCGATANNNVNIDIVGDIPTALPSDYMISVTATNNSDVRTFSGYGATTIDLGAPGASVWTTQPNNGYGSTSGTSFASPLTAGAIALIYSTPCPSFMALVHGDPQSGADYVRQMLFEGTDPIANLETECVTGGRLNVNNSINLILNTCSESECLTPFAVNATLQDQGEYLVNWGSLSSMLSFDLRYRMVGDLDWILIENFVEDEYLLTNLVWCASYEVQVSAECTEEVSDWSNSLIINTVGCCEAPSAGTFTVGGISDTGATISWPAVLPATSYNILFGLAGGQLDLTEGITDITNVFANLEPCTVYEFVLQVVCEDETLEFTESFFFNTTGCGACSDLTFCESTADDASEEWIAGVSMNTLNSVTGSNDGYGDFTGDFDLVTTLNPGGTYSITLTPGFDGFEYNEHFVVWLDLNQNGIFDDEEVMYDAGEPTTVAITGEIVIPVDAYPGSLRMRVGMKYVGGFGGDAPTPCEVYDYGEVEDYCVTISTDISVNELAVAEEMTLFPNPASEQLFVKWGGNEKSVLEILDLTGRVVFSSQLSAAATEVVPTSQFAEGSYFARIRNENGTADVKQFHVMH